MKRDDEPMTTFDEVEWRVRALHAARHFHQTDGVDEGSNTGWLAVVEWDTLTEPDEDARAEAVTT